MCKRDDLPDGLREFHRNNINFDRRLGWTKESVKANFGVVAPLSNDDVDLKEKTAASNPKNNLEVT